MKAGRDDEDDGDGDGAGCSFSILQSVVPHLNPLRLPEG